MRRQGKETIQEQETAEAARQKPLQQPIRSVELEIERPDVEAVRGNTFKFVAMPSLT